MSQILSVLEFHEAPLWDFQTATDVVLVAEEKQFHVHKSVLTKASPVFKVMLQSGNFKEKDTKIINLPGKKKEDIHRLLLFLYPYGLNITSNDVLEISCYLVLLSLHLFTRCSALQLVHSVKNKLPLWFVQRLLHRLFRDQ